MFAFGIVTVRSMPAGYMVWLKDWSEPLYFARGES